MVIGSLLPTVTDADYYLCTNGKCDIAYYSSESDLQIKKEQVKVPIWFKEDANPKYICYCNQVTEENIVNAVKNEGARNTKDIIRLTGAMKNGKCEVNHPTGKCCNPIIQEAINKALEI
ncbi:BFD domain protein (2Fe-2S)-binding domain protein [Alkaliphilus metalliredigens QYMF]|uniref:BFD domain protein (2Fe-2S)-binding domain protein n=2 Tax=Alkaliphilus TaxID=114627 RepID=A6TP00_ALKMQ|nr:BFD domain protein (2Fe-2S)-binding domain protein [Alkaliphilus metalliredigens QYMF]